VPKKQFVRGWARVKRNVRVFFFDKPICEPRNKTKVRLEMVLESRIGLSQNGNAKGVLGKQSRARPSTPDKASEKGTAQR